MRISDWSSDVCSSDLGARADHQLALVGLTDIGVDRVGHDDARKDRLHRFRDQRLQRVAFQRQSDMRHVEHDAAVPGGGDSDAFRCDEAPRRRSEEHTSELQSLMRISYAVFCLKKKKEATRITR